MIDDLDRIMAIMETAFDPQWGEAWTRAQVAGSLSLPTTYYYFVRANEEEEPVGFALVRAAPGEEELLLIAVQPQFRGAGMAKRLLEQFTEAARERGAERIFLEMRENNPAEKLYRTFGFETIGRRPKYYSKPDGSRIDAITFGLCI